MATEKQHMERELAAAWAATDKMRKPFTTIKISEKSTSTPCGAPAEALNMPCRSRWWNKDMKMNCLKQKSTTYEKKQ